MSGHDAQKWWRLNTSCSALAEVVWQQEFWTMHGYETVKSIVVLEELVHNGLRATPFDPLTLVSGQSEIFLLAGLHLLALPNLWCNPSASSRNSLLKCLLASDQPRPWFSIVTRTFFTIEQKTFVLFAACQGGSQGSIRSWILTDSGNVVLYNIKGNRFCGNIGRQHKSNGIFYVGKCGPVLFRS